MNTRALSGGGSCSDVEDHHQKIHRSGYKLWQEDLVLDVLSGMNQGGQNSRWLVVNWTEIWGRRTFMSMM